MADRLRSRAAATSSSIGARRAQLPRRSSLGAWLGGDEAAEAEYAYQRLQEAFAEPLGGARVNDHISANRPDDRSAMETPSTFSDIGRGGAAGLRLGAEGLLGTFGDFNQKRGDIAAYVADKVFGASPETQRSISDLVRRTQMPFMPNTTMAPTSDEIHRATTSLMGESYQPRTTAGEYSRSIGEMATNLVGGGGRLIPRLFTDVVLPGVASEAAGQAVEGTFLEPYVRNAASLLSPLASSGLRRAMVPHPSTTPQRPALGAGAISDESRFTANGDTAPTARSATSTKEKRLPRKRRRKGITAFGTHEMTPGRSTGHLPAVAEGSDAVRSAYAADPRSWWLNEGGRDMLYAAQGAQVDASQPMIGLFKEAFNPGQVATPRVSLSGPRGRRAVAPDSARMMTGTEAFRAYMDAQDAGAWSTAIHGQNMGHNNAYEVALNERMRTPAGLTAAREAAGMPDVIHYGGQRAVVTNFDDPPGLSARLNREVDARMRRQVGSGASPVRREGGAVFFENDWKNGEGSEAATKWMLAHLGDTQMAALDTPEVRRKVLARFEHDAEVSARLGTPVRQDIQTARRIFAANGFKGLRAALGQGILPVAAAGVFLAYAQDDDA